MDATPPSREERKQELLKELAEIMTEEQVEEGVFLETPHYSLIELQAMKLGQELAQEAQERAMREVAANCDAESACPTCQRKCPVQTKTREVASLSGPVALTESVARCRRCRRDFFPSEGGLGTE